MELEWQENPPEKLMNWNEATQYADSLGEGWRLPTIEELISAYEDQVIGFRYEVYWSSSTYDQDVTYAWVVYIEGDPDIIVIPKKSGLCYVHFVREVK
jgi:hypothetical protein